MAESPLTSIDLMNDGATLAVGSTRGKIYIYDLRQGMSAPVKFNTKTFTFQQVKNNMYFVGATAVQTLAAHKSSVQGLTFQHSKSSKVCR